MADIEGIAFEPRFGLLVCKVHGTGVHPDAGAIKRHLRGKRHFCKGPKLREAVAALLELPLRSRQALHDAQPPVAIQPIPAIAHLKISPGWSCRACYGKVLTTSEDLRDRHVSKVHQTLASSHSVERTLWDPCELQTFFSMTGDAQYFRVTSDASGDSDLVDPERVSPDQTISDNPDFRQQASDFLGRLGAQRKEHESIAAETANVIPDPAAQGAGEELWMKKLGVNRYVAKLRKDEMAASYKACPAEDSAALKDLRDVSGRVLRETWQWCQHGSQQRMTDPQAARISSFWYAADPERRSMSFRRTLQKETMEMYYSHWAQMLTFMWNGWLGKLFPQSLAALAANKAGKAAEDDEDDEENEDDEDSSGSDDSSNNSNSNGSSIDCLGDVKDSLASRYLHRTKRQKQCIQDFLDISMAWNNENNNDQNRKYERLKASAIAVSMSLIQQHLAGSPFESPILAYAAMLSVDSRFLAWTEPASFNSHLSALIYCGQLWVFRFACDAADQQDQNENEREESDDGLDEQLDLQMRRYFCNTVSKPLSYLLLWRRRLFGIAPVTMVNRPATWDLAKTTVTYQGISITMDEVRHLCRFAIERARDMLFNKLMFGADHITRLTPVHLQENDSERGMGWWFGKHDGNKALLNGNSDVLVEHVVNTPGLRELYMEERVAEDGQLRLVWRTSGIRHYRQLVQEFLRELAAPIHFGAGPPVRGSEFLCPMWYNTEQLRHIQIRYGKVLIHLVEHKMMMTTGKNVNNIRFLPDELGELVVNYLAYPIGVLQSMAWQEDIKSSISPYLWVDADGERWQPKRFADLLKSACRRACVPVIGTATWRQMSSAIINKHFDEADRACFAVAQDAEVRTDDVDEEGADSLAATLVSMSNHSLRTHRQAYANVSPFANIWDGKLLRSHRASEAWAGFFGLGHGEEHSPGEPGRAGQRKRRLSNAAREQEEVARKVLNIGRERQQRYWSGAALLEEARKLYQNGQLKWRCPEQERAVRLVANQAPEVLLVLATGSGKSLPFMLGSSLPGAKTTIVIVPLVLLRLDLLRRCRDFGLTPVAWSSTSNTATGMDGTPTLLFVSVEVAAKHPFRQYARRLYDTGNLDRFMIDECHLVQTSAHYRKTMTQLNELRQFRVPFIYMTATLPLRLEKILFQRHHMGGASIVRGCTKRPNLRYGVEYLQPPRGQRFLSFACQTAVQKWTSFRRPDWKDARVMIFVRSCADAEEAAEYIGCSYYHREIGTTEEKEVRLREWVSGESGSPFLACTTAAGAGVDYPHVRWVVHIEDPYGLIDFTQESGRGGRDGEPAGSSVYMKRDPRLSAPPTPLDHPDPIDHQAINEYLRGLECRRLILARELDEHKFWQACGPTDIKCDICETREKGGQSTTEVRSEVGESRSREKPDGEPEKEGTGVGGLIRYRRQQMQEQYEMDEYLRQLLQVKGGCMICKLLTPGADWKHGLVKCVRKHKWQYIRCKEAVIQRSVGRQWFKSYSACYLCGQPQSICGAWEVKERMGKGCEYRDLVMPAMWALWEDDGEERAWMRSRLEVDVNNAEEVLIAAARVSQFGGVESIIGVKIFAEMLDRWSGKIGE